MIDSFLRFIQYEKRYSPKTIISYKTDLRQFEGFLQTAFPDFTIETVDYGLARAWIVSLVEADLDATTVNRKIACLRSFYKFLIRQEVIEKDPMDNVRILKSKKKLPQFVKENDIQSLLDEHPFSDDHEGWRDKMILELFYCTGMRLSELINLKDSDIDLKNRTLKVLGKRNKERVIPFGESMVSKVKAYRAKRDREVGNRHSNNLFVTNSGAPLYPMMVYRSVKKHLELFSAIEKRSPHVLRHSYATHLMNKGAEINAIKDLLGHSSLAATQVYTHNSIEKLKKVFQKAHPKA